MNRSNLYRFVGAGVLAASVSLAGMTQAASAQTSTNRGSTDSTASQGVDNAGYKRDGDFNLGWLGLLGLGGLAGLARKREQPVRHRERDEVSSSGYRR